MNGVVPSWLDKAVGRIKTSGAGRFLGSPTAPPDARPCAVLMVFSPDVAGSEPADSKVLLTRRAHTLRSHPGQVSFPGGVIDPDDDGPAAAAVREAWEETGLDPGAVRVAGCLPSVYVAHSGNVVTPVVAWAQSPTPVRVIDPAEVASVHWVSVDHLLAAANRFRVRHPSGFLGPGFAIPGSDLNGDIDSDIDSDIDGDTNGDELLVWGLTGGILDQFFSLADWARPWDPAVTAELVDAATVSRRGGQLDETPFDSSPFDDTSGVA